MTEYHIIYVAFIAIFLAVLFSTAIIMINSALVKTELRAAEEMKKINRVHAASVIEQCLRSEGDVIKTDFLDKNNNKDLCRICDICSIDIYVNFTNLENGKSWFFRHGKITVLEKMTFKRTERYLFFTNLLDTQTNKIVMGRMDVET